MTKRIRALAIVIAATAALMAGFVVAPVSVPQAQAADGSTFDPGMIISDETFYSPGAMSTGQIQSFLNDKGSGCRANALSCVKDIVLTYPGRGADAYCGALPAGNGVRAADLFAAVASACNINPQVLLVLVEKEQSLVSRKSPSDYSYRYATGFGCPDTAGCDETSAGFAAQIYYAAKQFQRYRVNASSFNYQAGRANNIQYNPNVNCGSSSVFIVNQATAGLYNYTPYQPNAAALANVYGYGDGCSAYGNRNFWRMFTDWFGSTTEGALRSPSFEGGSVSGWGASNGFINQMAAKDNRAHHGEYFLATNTAVSGRALSQDVQRATAPGDKVSVSIWARSADAQPFTGVIALWGLGGGTTDANNVTFTVGDQWTQIKLDLPIRAGNHSTIRLDAYLTTTGGTLWIDDATMNFGKLPPIQNLLAAPSFEGDFGNWSQGNGFMNQQIYQDPSLASDGAWFAATNTPVAGRSLAQINPIPGSASGTYVLRIWLRSGDPGQTFTGRLALWGLGGSRTLMSVTPFTVDNTWQEFSVTVDASPGEAAQLKSEIYLDETSKTLWLDNAVLGKNNLSSPSFEGGAFDGWGAGNGTMNYAVYPSHDANIAKDGGWFAATNTATAGGSMAQVVNRQTTVGDRFTGEVWLRSADPAKTFSGTLALWGLGGATEVGQTAFTVGAEWTKVQVSLPITQPDHTQLKLEMYLTSTDNTLFVDAARLY